MAVTREIIDQIRDRSDLVEIVGRYVALRRTGNAYVGLCPFHTDKAPSFSVVPHKGIFHCFGCGEGGDVFKFVMKVQGLTFIEAVKELAGPAGITIEDRALTPEERTRIKARATLYDVCEAACAWFQNVLLVRPEGAAGRAYLQKRGLQRETVDRFRIGYAPVGWTHLLDHLQGQGFLTELILKAGLGKRSERGQGAYDVFRGRVTFPILDARDRVVSFGGRLVEEAHGASEDTTKSSPKYLNGPETEIYDKSKVLYGLSLARNAIQREDRAIIVEGYFDVVSLAQAGFEEVVATCGTALTADHLQVLRRFTRRVVGQFDADEAGVKAAIRSMPLFADAGMEAVRIHMPEAKDPDEFVQRMGADLFRSRLQGAEPLMDLVIRKEAARFGSTPMGRQRMLETMAPIVRRFPDTARAVLVRRLSDVLYLPEAEVARSVQDPKPPTRSQEPVASPRRAPVPKEIEHLLWLLIHHQAAVSPHLEKLEPSVISGRMEILECIGRLHQQWPLSRILDETSDPDLRALLGRLATKDDLYPPAKAARAAQQVLARIELRSVEERLAGLHTELSTCGVPEDRARFLEQRVRLQGRQTVLRALIKGNQPS